MDVIKTKNAILAAVYSGDLDAFERLYAALAAAVQNQTHFSEHEQKAVNQIQAAVSAFVRKGSLKPNQAFDQAKKRIRSKLSGVVRQQLKNPEFVPFDSWFSDLGISRHQYRILLHTTAMVQLTVGCSNFCRRCNEWALPGPRKHFAFSAATALVDGLRRVGNRTFSLYGASDPLDWQHDQNDIGDLLDYMARLDHGTDFGLLTKIPKRRIKTAQKLLAAGADIGVSVTSRNRKTVAGIEKKIGRRFSIQHDVEHLDIPAGLDEDFASVKSSITDYYGTEITPEGASLVIPAFTSALHPTGQHRIPVSPDTSFFLDKKTGRDALAVDYFKPLSVMDLDGKTHRLPALLDGQIENILLDNGDADVTPPGMMTMREYFSTYDRTAVQQRKKLLPSVFKGLRNDLLGANRQAGPSRKARLNAFKKKARRYLDFCSVEGITPYKVAAFSFYLKAIADYLHTHPAEREIVLFLRRKDRPSSAGSIDDTGAELRRSDTRTSFLFQVLLFRLLDHPEDQMIRAFTARHPAEYDALTDTFSPCRTEYH